MVVEGEPLHDAPHSPRPPRVNNLTLRVRLDYLDGLRAVAALYVSCYHITLTALYGHNLYPYDVPAPLSWLAECCLCGHYAVSVFIIVSGYCLMLPVAKGGGGRLPGGVAAFLGRRAWRLLPPYYAALFLSLLLTLLPGMDVFAGSSWDDALPAWDRSTILSHLCLVQNWSSEWYFKIDPPSWSVAAEWQIYGIFAFFLLPLARWVGTALTAALALGAGIGMHLHYNGYYDFMYWSYVGLFALGMLGATINFSAGRVARFCRERLPWSLIAALAWAAVLWVALSPRLGLAWMHFNFWLTDPLWGLATMCLLVHGTRAVSARSAGRASSSLAVRFLEQRWLVLIGGFSYSYYLVHDPIVNVLHFVLRGAELPHVTLTALMFALGVPLCLAGAYLFHLVFERPFMPGQPASMEHAARAAIVSPAP